MVNKKKNNKEIDDIFMYNFKKNLLIGLLILGLGMIIWGLSSKATIDSNQQKILANKFFLLKVEKSYKKAEKINKDKKFGKIDTFDANDLLDLIDMLRKELSTYGTLDSFGITALNFTNKKIKTLSVSFKVTLDDKEKAFDLLNKLINYNILTKNFGIINKNGLWEVAAKTQIYYTGKLSKDLYKKFKEKEVGDKKNVDKIIKQTNSQINSSKTNSKTKENNQNKNKEK